MFKMPVNIAYSVYSQKPNKSTRQKYGVELKVLSHVQKYYKLWYGMWQKENEERIMGKGEKKVSAPD